MYVLPMGDDVCRQGSLICLVASALYYGNIHIAGTKRHAEDTRNQQCSPLHGTGLFSGAARSRHSC